MKGGAGDDGQHYQSGDRIMDAVRRVGLSNLTGGRSAMETAGIERSSNSLKGYQWVLQA